MLHRRSKQLLRIANGEWSVSPDGSQIVFVDAVDYGLYRLMVE